MERTPATVEEVQAIANAMPKHLASSVIVAAWSGLRRGELFSLARKHVDLETGAIRVERTLTRDRTFSTPKTRSSIRTVYLPRFVVDVLAEHMATYTGKDPDALIWSSEGKPIREATVSANYKKARTKAGRPELRWHDLRHTGATLAYQAGGNVRDVQRRLGHATARAAMIYAHAADNGDKLLAQRLDEAFSPKHEPTPPTPPAPTPLAQQQLGAIARPVFRVIQGGKAIA
ncbi:tyrosine-type recombinase/integrase [Propionimicrobium lymphophilum]|uniref:tyrosine-type recombinase/integrase n=1 Tax=Propionimicrobium lymphophilum TaxID=33012 RepID=UPI00288C3F07|nr:site-specific integrase [Propionimicrobium lymphophilum]